MATYESTYGSFRALTLENEQVRIVMVPEVGGKIVSLCDKRTRHEWLSPIAPAALRQPQPDADFAEYASGGWDECFPSISRGLHPDFVWKTHTLADHGELWSRPWSFSINDEAISSIVQGQQFPYIFERRIKLEAATVVVDYRVTHTGGEPFSGMWAMHPLFVAEPGLRIVLPEVTTVSIDYSSDSTIGVTKERIKWPRIMDRTGQQRDLSLVMPPVQPLALKLYTPRLSQGWVALAGPAHWLAMAFDPAHVPFCGLWLNYAGWPSPDHGLYQVALEPCSGAADDLAEALPNGVPVVSPPAPLEWQIKLALGLERSTFERFVADVHVKGDEP